jgi:hypothetical protein
VKPAPRQDLVTAAAVGRLDLLRRSKQASAVAFARSLSLEFHLGETGDLSESDPLAAAAIGLEAELNGKTARAIDLYQSIGGSFWADLLSDLLVGWTKTPQSGAAIERAAEAVRTLDSSEDKALLFAKLFAFCLDKGMEDQAAQYSSEAISALSGRSALRALLLASRANVFGPSPEFLDSMARPVRVPAHLRLPWIESLALDGARKTIVDAVKTTARSPWSWNMTIGRTPLHDAIAAELQATWTGAIWLRKKLHAQIGAQYLLGGASGADEYAYGTGMWLRGGGGDIESVIDHAERFYDSGSADSIIEDYAASLSVGVGQEYDRLRCLISLWDLVGEGVALKALREYAPTSDQVSFADERRALWGVLFLRVPEQWTEMFLGLEPATQESMLGSISPLVARRMGSDLRQVLRSLIEKRSSRLDDDVDEALLSLACEVEAATAEVLSRATAPAIAHVAADYGEAIPEDVRRAALSEIRVHLDAQLNEVQSGSETLWALDPYAHLSNLSSGLPDTTMETADFLLRVASEQRLSADSRIRALMAIGRIRRATGLSEKQTQLLAELRLEPRASEWRPVSSSAFVAAKAFAHASRRDGEFLSELISLSRDDDPRARQLTQVTVSDLLRGDSSSLLEAVLLGGLFDPSDSVVIEALGGLHRLEYLEPETLAAFRKRLISLYATGRRRLRAEVIHAIRSSTDKMRDSSLERLVAAARADRSWLVRDAATRPTG